MSPGLTGRLQHSPPATRGGSPGCDSLALLGDGYCDNFCRREGKRSCAAEGGALGAGFSSLGFWANLCCSDPTCGCRHWRTRLRSAKCTFDRSGSIENHG
jgi:hypothetical protein